MNASTNKEIIVNITYVDQIRTCRSKMQTNLEMYL